MEVVITGIYVYAHDASEFVSTGLAGDLRPVSCYFEEEKNGMSQLTMQLHYDEYGKWQQVKVGRYIKAKVPVRTPPNIENNAYANMVESYRVIEAPAAAAFSFRASARAVNPDLLTKRVPLFFNSKDRDYDVPSALLGVGDIVYKKGKSNKPNPPPKQEEEVYSPGNGSGVMAPENLEYIEQVTIPPSLNGMEAAAGSVRLEYQLFIVTDVVQGDDVVDITAVHVFYDLLHNYTTFKTENEISGAAACVSVFQQMISPDDRFSVLSNCTDTVKGLNYDQQSVAQALLDPEEGICARFDAALLRDNYMLYVIKGAGGDRGFVVEYGKNLLGVEYTENIDETFTRIVPWGVDKDGKPVYMDGTKYVDSPHVDDYPAPRVLLLDCSDTATESDEMTLEQVKAELKRRAEAELEGEIDKPQVSMTVDFVSLGDTEEYKQYRDLDKVFMLDHIAVKHPKRNYNFSAEVTAIRHNVITGMLEEATIGNLQKGSSTRKIATWQVPTVDGSNIRLQSITAGSIGPGAILESAIRNGVITVDKIAANSITADKIAAGAVTAAKISAGAVTAGKIAADAIDVENLKAGAVTADKIESKTITADKLQSGLITAESGLIGEGAIGTAQIANGSITDAKIVELTANKINAGTLSVERLVIVGSEESIVFAINEANGTAQLSQTTIDGGSLTERSITADRIVAGSITSDEIAANAITANHILAGSITTEKLDALSVTADKLAAESVTANKLASDVGRTLDLSSNESVKASVVSGVENSAATLTANQFSLSFDGKNVMEVDADSAVFDVDTLTATGQIIGNVVNTQSDVTITVPSGGSIQSVINNLGKYLNGWVTINIQGAHAENVLIEGFKGKYALTLNVENGAYLQGTISVRQCDYVRIWCPEGMQKTAFVIPPVGGTGISAINVGCFECNNVYVAGQDGASGRGFYLANGTHAQMYRCNASKVQYGYFGYGNAMVAMYDCIGGGEDGLAFGSNAVLAQWGAMMSLYGNGPYGTQNAQGNFGFIRDYSSAKVASGGTTPTVAQTVTMTPSSSKGAVYGTSDGSGGYVHPWGYYTNPFQGKNKGAGGYMFGLWLFADDYTAFYNAINGKTIQTATVTIKRADAYGVDGSTVHLFYHGLTSVQSSQRPSEILTSTGLSAKVDRGKNVTFTLTSDLIAKLQNGTIKGFGLSSAGSTDLMQFEGTVCDVSVVYTA